MAHRVGLPQFPVRKLGGLGAGVGAERLEQVLLALDGAQAGGPLGDLVEALAQRVVGVAAVDPQGAHRVDGGQGVGQQVVHGRRLGSLGRHPLGHQVPVVIEGQGQGPQRFGAGPGGQQ